MSKRISLKISLFSGVMLALSSLIGSGWLFGAGEAAKVAGPASIISWVLGAIIMIVIAFNYVELGAMFPESGGMSRFAQYSHGSLLGFIAAWANWISLITIIPIEAVASVQYMSSWPWSWAKWMHKFVENGQISNLGLGIVFLFIIVFTLFNYWSVKLLTSFTSTLSLFKLIIPTLTIIILISSGFHTESFGNNLHTFMPYGSSAILEATTVSGIIFSYDAFQTIINLGGEMVKPHKNILRGIVISLSITAIIYILLQITFIGSIPSNLLLKYGWHGINFASPFADLAILLGINWLTILLYIDAFASPFGTGVAFVATAGRTLSAMTKNKHIPQWLGHLNSKYRNPRNAMVANLILSFLLVSIFRDWSKLASVIAASTLIAYLTGPVTAVALREMRPQFKRPFKPKSLKIVAPISFILTSLAIYWAMWPTTIEVIIVIILGVPFYVYYEYKNSYFSFAEGLKGSLWLIVYLVFISVCSYLGSKNFGGMNILVYPYDNFFIGICSLLFYIWGVKSRVNGSDLNDAAEVNKSVIMPDDKEEGWSA